MCATIGARSRCGRVPRVPVLAGPLDAHRPDRCRLLGGAGLGDQLLGPRGQFLVTQSGHTITVEGLPRPYYAAPNGTLTTLQTDINTSGVTSQTFTPSPPYTATSPVRDLKIKLAGVDSEVQVGDQSGDGVTVGRDLIISMPATTTASQLAYDSIYGETHLNVVLESDMVARNLTITTGTTGTTGPRHRDLRAGSDHRGRRHRGHAALKGTLTITTNGDVPNMIGLAADDVVGNASVTTVQATTASRSWERPLPAV